MSTDEPVDGWAIKLAGLCKQYGKVPALNGLSLSLRHGEIFGLLGPNGAGKTTTLRILCGLLAPDEGEGHCLGLPLGTAQHALGYVPQRGSLYDDLTVAENLMFFARAHLLDKPRMQVQRILDEHGLQTQARQRAAALSGGWRQRVALAAALLHSPRLLLLDEPTAGLDPEAREQLWHRLRDLATRGVSILVTTHYADEASRCDRAGYLGGGRLRAEGPPAQLARSLGLHVWRIAASENPLPEAKHFRVSRDSQGWRAIARESELPSILEEWCRQNGGVAESVESGLGDVLTWLASAESP